LNIEFRYMIVVTLGLSALIALKALYIGVSTSHQGPFWIGCLEPQAVYLCVEWVSHFTM
jgi:hypothetical protein